MNGADGKDGADGTDGRDGADGNDGRSFWASGAFPLFYRAATCCKYIDLWAGVW